MNENFEQKKNKALNKTDVMRSCCYTNNSFEIRKFLEKKGFIGLSFFQGKEFIYAFLTQRANSKKTWYEKNYATFNEKDRLKMDFLKTENSTKEDFINYVNTLLR